MASGLERREPAPSGGTAETLGLEPGADLACFRVLPFSQVFPHAAAIVAHAKTDAEEFAAETRRKLAESLERRTRQAEQKIAQAEASAIKDVRHAATEMAIAAAQSLVAEGTKGAKGADLIATSIEAVKNRLN